MIGVEFGSPKSLKLKTAWGVLEGLEEGVVLPAHRHPLFKDHKILSKTAGEGSNTIKLIPPLCCPSRLRLDRARIRCRDRGQPRGAMRARSGRSARAVGAAPCGEAVSLATRLSLSATMLLHPQFAVRLRDAVVCTRVGACRCDCEPSTNTCPSFGTSREVRRASAD